MSTRAVAAAGVTRAQLRGPLWRSPHRDVHVWSGLDANHPRTRALAAALLLPPTGALGGWAAAWLLGVTDLDGTGRSGRALEPVGLVLPPPSQLRPREGVVRVRSALEPEDVFTCTGARVTSPVRTAVDLARGRPGPGELVEAVAALDAVLHVTDATRADVEAYALAHPRWHGVRRARQALALADPRARSRGESRLRVMWLLQAGLPRPECNVDILDAAGRFLGCVDLLEPRSGLVAEYDGAGHREASRHARDNEREERLEDAGLVVVRLSAGDLARPGDAVRRLVTGHRRACDSAGPRRWSWRPSPFR